jgi:rod shape-determining protein MreD
VSLLSALAVLLAGLVLQAGLAGVWPESHRFVDALLVPVVVYGVAGSQRAAMLLGCGAGLLRDSWFEAGIFGINGFKRTLLGWALSSIAQRLDLNHPTGRFVAGGALSLADGLLDLGLRGLLEQPSRLEPPWELLARFATTGLLSAAAGSILDRRGRVPGPRE